LSVDTCVVVDGAAILVGEDQKENFLHSYSRALVRKLYLQYEDAEFGMECFGDNLMVGLPEMFYR
jgi:hypothetical protein